MNDLHTFRFSSPPLPPMADLHTFRFSSPPSPPMADLTTLLACLPARELTVSDAARAVRAAHEALLSASPRPMSDGFDAYQVALDEARRRDAIFVAVQRDYIGDIRDLTSLLEAATPTQRARIEEAVARVDAVCNPRD
jgi:hypothetical protein